MLKDTVDFAKSVEEMMRQTLGVPLDEPVEEEPIFEEEEEAEPEEEIPDEEEEAAPADEDVESMKDEL